VVEICGGIGRTELTPEHRVVLSVGDAVVVQVRIAGVAVTITVAVDLVGVRELRAVVQAVRSAIAIRIGSAGRSEHDVVPSDRGRLVRTGRRGARPEQEAAANSRCSRKYQVRAVVADDVPHVENDLRARTETDAAAVEALIAAEGRGAGSAGRYRHICNIEAKPHRAKRIAVDEISGPEQA